jgi:hypothetical protein
LQSTGPATAGFAAYCQPVIALVEAVEKSSSALAVALLNRHDAHIA